MRTSQKIRAFGSFVIELAVYALFVFAYFMVVLHFLGGWLRDLFDHHRTGYAFAALFYFVFCYAMSRYSAAVERRLALGRRQ